MKDICDYICDMLPTTAERVQAWTGVIGLIAAYLAYSSFKREKIFNSYTEAIEFEPIFTRQFTNELSNLNVSLKDSENLFEKLKIIKTSLEKIEQSFSSNKVYKLLNFSDNLGIYNEKHKVRIEELKKAHELYTIIYENYISIKRRANNPEVNSEILMKEINVLTDKINNYLGEFVTNSNKQI